MFIINGYGNRGEKLKSVSMEYDYDKEIKDECQKIYDDTMRHAYYLGSTQNAREEARKRQNDYLANKVPLCRIFVNNKIFGEYQKETGENVFKTILQEKKNKIKYLDMRDIAEVIDV